MTVAVAYAPAWGPSTRIYETSLTPIGIRRRSPEGKFIMGSTAQQIILDSPVPSRPSRSQQKPTEKDQQP